MWNYSFRLWCPQDLNAKLTISVGVVIHVRSGHGIDPYFDIPMHRSMKG
jgi:hypothetical protein